VVRPVARAVLSVTFGVVAAILGSVPAAGAQGYGVVAKWGSSGSGNGQFAGPAGVATDATGNVYVADYDNDRIQKFTSDGAFITKWGSEGSGNGQFDTPNDVATDAAGNVYVVDISNNRIQKFTSSGAFITKWGSQGSGNGQFSQPLGVATDAAGNVYVTDGANRRVQKFNSGGGFITKWGSYGSGDNQFIGASGVATDAAGNVYVVDQWNGLVQKFTSSGAFITKWGGVSGPFGVATDAAGNVYVAATFGRQVQKFTSSGALITRWGSQGSGDGQCLGGPVDVATDAAGNIYASDGYNNRIQKFSPFPVVGPGQGGGLAPLIVAGCLNRPAGATGRSLGAARLGLKRKVQRARFKGARLRSRKGLDRYCAIGGGAFRIGYSNNRLSKAAGKRLGRKIKGRVALILTSSKRFTVKGVRYGDSGKGLGSRKRKIGRNTWHLFKRKRGATLLVVVRGGKVKAVGIGDSRLTSTRRITKGFLTAWELGV